MPPAIPPPPRSELPSATGSVRTRRDGPSRREIRTPSARSDLLAEGDLGIGDAVTTSRRRYPTTSTNPERMSQSDQAM